MDMAGSWNRQSRFEGFNNRDIELPMPLNNNDGESKSMIPGLKLYALEKLFH